MIHTQAVVYAIMFTIISLSTVYIFIVLNVSVNMLMLQEISDYIKWSRLQDCAVVVF